MKDLGENCPCGSGNNYQQCCHPCHAGTAADTPEALMRSRFSAFVMNDADYLLATWHPDTRPVELDLSESPEWVSLQILSASEQITVGQVHFRAIYRIGSGWGYLEEQSSFSKENGRWFYREGKTSEGALKPGRNNPCPCGSGRKFKACCL